MKLWLKNSQKQNTSTKLEPIAPSPKHMSSAPKIKLPKTDLRKFSGDVLEKPELWDIFRVAVHDNVEIPTVPLSVDDRFKKVKEIRACFRSAQSGHRMTACRFRKPCLCGRGSHIPQLCKTGGVKIPEVQNPTPSTGNLPNHRSWNPAAPPYTPTNQSHLPLLSQPPKAAVMSSAKNADIKTAGVMMRTVCCYWGCG